MPKLLSPEQVAAYERDGFVFPVDVLHPDEVRALREELESWEQERGAPIDFPEKSKSYLLFDWADQLAHHPKILDAVEDLIGPDILVYHSTLFLKEAHTPAFVRWHQDSTSFYLEPHLHLTAWVALSDATVQAGCMQMLPGSHRWGRVPGEAMPDPAATHPDEIVVEAPAGSVIVFNSHLWHGGTRNRSPLPRRAFARPPPRAPSPAAR